MQKARPEYKVTKPSIQNFFNNLPLIRRIGQKGSGQKWGLSPGYPDYFPTAIDLYPLPPLALSLAFYVYTSQHTY